MRRQAEIAKQEVSKSKDNAPTMNTYVISYKRSDTTKVHTLLEYCTYVIRESERKDYEKLGVNLLCVEDSKVNSFANVNNWLIENAPEDVIAVLDDDISQFMYQKEKIKVIDKETTSREIERLCQLLYDLDVGLLGIRIGSIPYGYLAEFHFSGMIGPLRIYNRKKVKARYINMPFFGDTDFVLQELLLNRIILRPDYLVTNVEIELNKGGMNISRNKKQQDETAEQMQNKWGKYFSFKSSGKFSNVTKVMVQR